MAQANSQSSNERDYVPGSWPFLLSVCYRLEAPLFTPVRELIREDESI